jgi:hypothetical protein
MSLDLDSEQLAAAWSEANGYNDHNFLPLPAPSDEPAKPYKMPSLSKEGDNTSVIEIRLNPRPAAEELTKPWRRHLTTFLKKLDANPFFQAIQQISTRFKPTPSVKLSEAALPEDSFDAAVIAMYEIAMQPPSRDTRFWAATQAVDRYRT